MGVFSGGRRKQSNATFALLFLLLIVGHSSHKLGRGIFGTICLFIFAAIYLPVRICRRVKKSTWKALGWDELR